MCRENLNCLLTEKCTNEIKIRADEREKVINKIFDKAYDVDMDSIFIYIRFDKDDFDVPFLPLKEQLKEWLKEQLLKEQKNDD